MRWDGWRAIEKQAGASLGKRGGAHGWFVSTLKVLPVRDLGGDSEQGKAGQRSLAHAELFERGSKRRGERLRQLGLPAFEALIDGEPLGGQPPIPGRVLLVVLEVGLQPGLKSPAGNGLGSGGPVDPAAAQGRHLVLESSEARLLVGEIEVERTLGEACRLHNRTNGCAVVAVTLEDPAGRFQQLAAADPLPFGQGRLVGRSTTD